MELQYYGANSIKITTKKSSILIDPVSDITNIKADLKKVSTVLATQLAFVPKNAESVFVVDGPGIRI